jgi:hypothetical protein
MRLRVAQHGLSAGDLQLAHNLAFGRRARLLGGPDFDHIGAGNITHKPPRRRQQEPGAVVEPVVNFVGPAGPQLLRQQIARRQRADPDRALVGGTQQGCTGTGPL